MPYIRLETSTFIPSVLGVFITRGCWILSNVFYVTIKIIVGFLPLTANTMCIDSQMVNQFCIPMTNPTWSWYIVFFYVLLDLVCLNFVEYFYIMFTRDIICNFLFMCYLWFGCQGNTSLIEWVKKGSLVFHFLKAFMKDWS